jgi:ABC-type phosphonate transport system ATPase subunit
VRVDGKDELAGGVTGGGSPDGEAMQPTSSTRAVDVVTVSRPGLTARAALRPAGRSPRALATDPKLLLLDEPTAGMNPQETRQAEELIFKIRDQGLAVVVIEHDMRFIFNLCDRVLCLVQGKALIEGTRPPRFSLTRA